MGAVFVLANITSVYRELQTTRSVTVFTVVSLMVIICGALVVLLSRLVFRRLTEITRVATRLVGGDLDTPVKVTAADEIGHFEELFEQLRVLFAGLIAQHERLVENADRDAPGHAAE